MHLLILLYKNIFFPQNSVYDLNDDEEQGIDAESTEDCLYINLYR